MSPEHETQPYRPTAVSFAICVNYFRPRPKSVRANHEWNSVWAMDGGGGGYKEMNGIAFATTIAQAAPAEKEQYKWRLEERHHPIRLNLFNRHKMFNYILFVHTLFLVILKWEFSLVNCVVAPHSLSVHRYLPGSALCICPATRNKHGASEYRIGSNNWLQSLLVCSHHYGLHAPTITCARTHQIHNLYLFKWQFNAGHWTNRMFRKWKEDALMMTFFLLFRRSSRWILCSENSLLPSTKCEQSVIKMKNAFSKFVKSFSRACVHMRCGVCWCENNRKRGCRVTMTMIIITAWVGLCAMCDYKLKEDIVTHAAICHDAAEIHSKLGYNWICKNARMPYQHGGVADCLQTTMWCTKEANDRGRGRRKRNERQHKAQVISFVILWLCQ